MRLHDNNIVLVGEASSGIVGQSARNVAVGKDPFGAPSFMRVVYFEAMNGPEFGEHANNGVAVEDGEFYIGMEFESRKLAIA
ncbi:hypothetical protein PIB30_049284 [Stylosanthes scabra]|uniref:Uncharacterized protein n=1 Tax=Stylosanthes scabra TaxID=79078 RepID=A0ABU6YFX3_9FABA|nr:hypothetical protein [Stylosanthes scabra]